MKEEGKISIARRITNQTRNTLGIDT